MPTRLLIQFDLVEESYQGMTHGKFSLKRLLQYLDTEFWKLMCHGSFMENSKFLLLAQQLQN